MKPFCPQLTVSVRDCSTEFIPSQGEAYSGINKITVSLIIAFCILFLSVGQMQAQYCNPNVPTFTVNLTGNPNGSWISPNIQRQDNCCGSLPPDVCVQFVVTLDPNSQGIVFDIFSGAVPPGALYYQVNCSPPTLVGQPICLQGVGPHYVTFCKPGNNNNEFIITSISQPGVGPGITINDGCLDTINVFGLLESSITWSSIYPGPPNTFNSYLSCTSGCDTTFVNGQPNAPTFVEFLVCGLPYGGCDSTPFCDTIVVYFNQTLSATIVPQNPTICFGSPGVWVTVNATGGTSIYNYLWSNGATTQNVFITGPGTYSVVVSDSTDCPATIASVTVTSFSAPITANAGPDINLCNTNLPFQLNGAVTGAPAGIWTGGNGTFTPNNTTLNATYNPTAAEIAAGSVTLELATTGNGTCPGDSDQVTLFINSFQAVISSSPTNVACNGDASGSCALNLTGGSAPFAYAWNTTPAQSGSNATGLSAGNYYVVITDANGCTGNTTISITQPPLLTLTSAGFPATCIGSCNGQATVIPAGGTGSFTFSWSPNGGTTALASGLCAGIYTITVTDQNGCTRSDTAIVAQPAAPPPVSFNVDDTVGCGTVCVQFTNTSPTAVSSNWNFGDNNTSNQMNPQHCYSPGIYNVTLTITDGAGCTNSVTSPAMVTVYSNPIANFTLGPQPTTILDPEICFSDHSTNDVITWYWNFDDPNDLNGSNQPNPCHTYSDTGTYCASLIVHNVHGCWATLTNCLKIQPYYTLYVPNAFTPDGDGLNDEFLPVGSTVDETTFKMDIFDRWGKIIFSTSKWGHGWDGHANGGPLPVQIGVYVWKIQVKDYTGQLHNLTGHVSVIK